MRDNLPGDASEVYKEAFNSVGRKCDEEGRAHRVAWAAVERKYEKNDDGRWVRIDPPPVEFRLSRMSPTP